MNKKAFMLDLIILLIIAFVVIIFFAAWMYGHGILTDVLTGIESSPGEVNISDAAEKTIGKVDVGVSYLPIIAFFMIGAMILSLFLTNFLIRAHPAFIIVYILIIIISIVVSVYLSNTYQELIGNEILGETFAKFKAVNFIMLNLPIWTTVIGFFGAIFLFLGIPRDSEFGGGLG